MTAKQQQKITKDLIEVALKFRRQVEKVKAELAQLSSDD